jgi:hypothetical protein
MFIKLDVTYNVILVFIPNSDLYLEFYTYPLIQVNFYHTNVA